MFCLSTLVHRVCGNLLCGNRKLIQILSSEVMCCYNKYLKMWGVHTWNWVVGRGLKNFEEYGRGNLDFLEQTVRRNLDIEDIDGEDSEENEEHDRESLNNLALDRLSVEI